eukprot:2533100-Amphidinium_carterae.1
MKSLSSLVPGVRELATDITTCVKLSGQGAWQSKANFVWTTLFRLVSHFGASESCSKVGIALPIDRRHAGMVSDVMHHLGRRRVMEVQEKSRMVRARLDGQEMRGPLEEMQGH